MPRPDPFAHLLADAFAPSPEVALDALDPPVFIADNGAFRSIEDPRGPILTDQDQEDAIRADAVYRGGGDQLTSATIERATNNAITNATAPLVSLVPPSWNRGLLGGRGDTRPQQVTQPTPLTQIVYWPGDDNESRPIAVAVAPTDGMPSSGTFRGVAQVVWGTREGRFSVLVDIGAGVQLNLVASSCFVSVGQDAGAPPSSSICSPLAYSATIGFLSTFTRGPQATRTIYADQQPQTTPVTFARPAFATAIAGFGRSDATVAWTINLLANSDIVHQIVVPASGQFSGPVPLPNDVNNVQLINSGAGPANARLTFGLSL
jgi:hypothetical protein